MERNWDWVKDKFADAVINVFVAGVTLLIAYGIIQAYLADVKADKLKIEMREEFSAKHKASVDRESELSADIATLKILVTEMAKETITTKLELEKATKEIVELKKTPVPIPVPIGPTGSGAPPPVPIKPVRASGLGMMRTESSEQKIEIDQKKLFDQFRDTTQQSKMEYIKKYEQRKAD